MRCLLPLLLMPALLVPWFAAPAVADAALDTALVGLGAPDPMERLRATNALARMRAEPERTRAARALERALFDEAPLVRRGALNALVDLDARAAGGAVARLLAMERDVHVLPAALMALGALQVAGHDALVVRYASHPAAAVRAAAMHAAGHLGGPALRRVLLNSLRMAGEEDEQWVVRASAVLALARLGHAEDLAVIRRAFQGGGGTSSWIARSAVAKAIGALDPQPRVPLERLMADADPRVAATAAIALAETGYGFVVLDRLAHGAAAIRIAAVTAVRRANLRKATPRLHHMARFDGARPVRFAAAITLFTWGDPAADAMMLDAVRSTDPAIWGEAVARLARRTGAQHGRDVKAWARELKRLRVREAGK